MKATFQARDLRKALATLKPIVPTKHFKRIMECVRFEPIVLEGGAVHRNAVRVGVTDLDFYETLVVPANVWEDGTEGALVLPYKILTDALGDSQGAVAVESGEGRPREAYRETTAKGERKTETVVDCTAIVTVSDTLGDPTVDGTRYTINGEAPEEWPTFEAPEPKAPGFEIEAGVLLDTLKRIAYATASEAGRFPGMTGVLLNMGGKRSGEIVATDGRRIALDTLPLAGFEGDSFRPILPVRLVPVLSAAKANGDPCRVTFEGWTDGGSMGKAHAGYKRGRIEYADGTRSISFRLIERYFPEYEAIMGDRQKANRTLRLRCGDLRTALKRATRLSTKFERFVTLTCDGSRVLISAKSENGKAEAPVKIEGKGHVLEAVNASPEFLAEAMTPCDDDEIVTLGWARYFPKSTGMRKVKEWDREIEREVDTTPMPECWRLSVPGKSWEAILAPYSRGNDD